MSSTTDRYRSRHGADAYARLAARASLAGLESLAAETLVATPPAATVRQARAASVRRQRGRDGWPPARS